MEALDRLKALVVPMFQRGLSWWLAELTALIPRRFASNPENAPAVLEVSTIQAAMRRRTSNAVIIRLDQSAILESSVNLPLNAERSLRPILQNQLERLVPLPADQVEFEYQIVARSPTTKTL